MPKKEGRKSQVPIPRGPRSDEVDLATQKIITFLDTTNYQPLPEIGKYLGTGSQAYDQLRATVYSLRAQGILKSTVGAFPNYSGRVEKFALTSVGEKRKRALEGKKSLAERVMGSVFILFSVGVLFYQETTPTGNMVGTTASTNTAIFLLSLALMIIGGVLFFKSFKRR